MPFLPVIRAGRADLAGRGTPVGSIARGGVGRTGQNRTMGAKGGPRRHEPRGGALERHGTASTAIALRDPLSHPSLDPFKILLGHKFRSAAVAAYAHVLIDRVLALRYLWDVPAGWRFPDHRVVPRGLGGCLTTSVEFRVRKAVPCTGSHRDPSRVSACPSASRSVCLPMGGGYRVSVPAGAA